MNAIVNIMTVDVEDYFQVSAMESVIARDSWDSISCRVENNTHKILDMFARHEAKATFFVLAWVAERYPALVKRIVAEGHELANHGYDHKRITQFNREEFKQDLLKSKEILEDIGSVKIDGYRAPSYSIMKDNLWAHDVLADCGFRYSSSVYPVKHDLYGIPDAPRFKYQTKAKGLIEYPITTVKLLGKNIPCGGGGFFRLYPYALSQWAIKRVNRIDQQPSIFYFHPWEIDPGQPKQQGISLKTRFRHYLNLHKMENRLERLLHQFEWTTMKAMI